MTTTRNLLATVALLAEEADGAYLAYVADTNDVITVAGTNAMAKVKFTCTPDNLPSNEMVTVSNGGHGELYLKEGNVLHLVTSNSFPTCEIASKDFRLHGHAASSQERDGTITIEHPPSGAKDRAKYTVVEFDFIAISKNRRPGSAINSSLTDNRETDITITTKPTIVDASAFSFSFESVPVESGELINKMGTDVTFIPSASPLIWSTTPVYWYGVKPDKECFSYDYAYRFTLRESGTPVKEREYNMCWPDGSPKMVRDLISRRSDSTISPPTIMTRTLPNGTQTNCYGCRIVFGGFAKDGTLVNLPSTDQYQVETQREEEYHLRQWRGTVPSQEGGTTDCYTAKGVQYFAKMYAQEGRLSFSMDGSDMLVFGDGPTNAWTLANEILLVADINERSTSSYIWHEDRGLVELKAKEFAGYNAAWRYHCVYEARFGSNPTNNVHPAFINP